MFLFDMLLFFILLVELLLFVMLLVDIVLVMLLFGMFFVGYKQVTMLLVC